jgi:hypothetical protein
MVQEAWPILYERGKGSYRPAESNTGQLGVERELL